MKEMFITICCLLIIVALVLSVPVLAEELDEDEFAVEEEIESEYETIELVEHPDDIEEEDFNEFSLFDRLVFLAGEIQFSSEFMGDYELDNKAKDDLLETEPALNVQVFYRISENTSVFLENEVQYVSEYFSEVGHTESQWVFERTESWIFFNNMADTGISLQIGRQNFEDDRQWWWDEQLDSIRVHYDWPGFHMEMAAAQELCAENTEKDRMDPEDENIFRILGHTAWGRNKALRLDAFVLYQDDHSSEPRQEDVVRPHKEDERDADLFWYGARISGELEAEEVGEFAYWVDAAGVTGDEKLFEFEETDEDYSEVTEIIKHDVSGWGFDTGLAWNTGIFSDMTFTLGYAWGAGDRTPEQGDDKSFRQTGFNEGDQRFQYYGELLNPDLSNLGIFTAAIGFEIGESSTIDFIYHQYRQDYATDFLWESDLEVEPEGMSKDIGEEFDIALTIEEWDNIEIESSAALFKAGHAFGPLSGETAYRLKFEINYLF